MPVLTYDTETTGRLVPNARPDNPAIAKLVQLAALLQDDDGSEIASLNVIVYPQGWIIPEAAANVHGISTEKAKRFGISLENATYAFRDMLNVADLMVAHNIQYDDQIIQHAYHMVGIDTAEVASKPKYCTMLRATNIVKAPAKARSGYKWPKLSECIRYFYDEDLVGAHDAMVDVRACARVFWTLQSLH